MIVSDCLFMLYLGQSCDIPDEFQNDGDNLRWFHRYDEGSILWLFKYKHDTFSQVTDTGSSEVGECVNVNINYKL